MEGEFPYPTRSKNESRALRRQRPETASGVACDRGAVRLNVVRATSSLEKCIMFERYHLMLTYKWAEVCAT